MGGFRGKGGGGECFQVIDKDEQAYRVKCLARLRAVSLFLENPWERTQNKKTCKRDCECDLRAAMPRAASSVGVGRRVKREITCDQTCFFLFLERREKNTPDTFI